MKDNLVSLEELLVFEPLSSCEWLGGLSGKENKIQDVIEMEGNAAINEGRRQGSSGTLPRADALAVVDLQVFSLDDVVSFLSNNPFIKGVVLSNAPRPDIETRVGEYIEEKSIPLVYSPFADIYLKVCDLLKFLIDIKKSDRFGNFTQSTIYYELKKMGYPECWRFLEHKIGNPILFFDNTFHLRDLSKYHHAGYAPIGEDVLSNRVPPEMIERILIDLRDKLGARVPTLQSEYSMADVGIYFPLYEQGYLYGTILALEQNNPLTQLDRIYLTALRELVLEQLVNKRNIESIEKKHIGDFIHDLLYNNFESKEEIINRGKHWGFNLTEPHQLYVIEPNNTENNGNINDLMDKIQLFTSEAVRLSNSQSIIGQIREQIVLIVPEIIFKNKTINKENAFSLASTLHRKLKTALPSISLAIGIGRYYPSILDLSRSFQEAKVSLELGKLIYDKNHISHFEDLGAVRLLASIDFIQLDDFYKEYLSGVILYDQQNETNLLDTLVCFFKYNGDVNAIAQKMYVHPNSLRYRLKKIEELTHADLKNYDDMLNLFIACKIANMKNSHNK